MALPRQRLGQDSITALQADAGDSLKAERASWSTNAVTLEVLEAKEPLPHLGHLLNEHVVRWWHRIGDEGSLDGSQDEVRVSLDDGIQVVSFRGGLVVYSDVVCGDQITLQIGDKKPETGVSEAVTREWTCP